MQAIRLRAQQQQHSTNAGGRFVALGVLEYAAAAAEELGSSIVQQLGRLPAYCLWYRRDCLVEVMVHVCSSRAMEGEW